MLRRGVRLPLRYRVASKQHSCRLREHSYIRLNSEPSHLHKPLGSTQTRSKVWFNPLSQWGKSLQDKDRREEQVVLEEPDDINNSAKHRLLADLKHYSRTTEIPKNLRRSILIRKLSELIANSPQIKVNDDTIPTINSALSELYKLNDKSLLSTSSEVAGILDFETLVVIFEKTADALMSLKEKVFMPQYMHRIISLLVKSDVHEVHPRALAHVILLSTAWEPDQLYNRLNALVRTRGTKLTPELVNVLIDYYEAKNLLNLQKFSVVFLIAKSHPQINLLDDHVYRKLILYIEKLYSEVPPSVHEYKDSERSVYRVQYIVSGAIDSALQTDKVKPGTLMHLAKLTHELNSVCKSEQLDHHVKKIFKSITNQPLKALKAIFEDVEQEFYSQDYDDENLIETILQMSQSGLVTSVAWKQWMFDLIEGNDIRFSGPLRFQNRLYQIFQKNLEASESSILNLVKTEVEAFVNSQNESPQEEPVEIDYNDLYNRIIQSAMSTRAVSPRGFFTHEIGEYFKKVFHVEFSVYSYKYRLDAAIESGNHLQAVNIFDDSLQDVVQWSHSQDPTIHATLNDLVVIICDKMIDINSIFPIFTKIKQQMSQTCNTPAVTALAQKMLAAEYVGDTIEMLKRELPPIKRDDTLKLPVNEPYGYEYRKLFNLLHNFVVSYTKEETFETNWVLYGELHKYFHVPYETYLPAMKFFCDKNRLNASLLMFRQIRRLSELHGDHRHLPPSREMYMYLFQQFGDKLYEEGVEEIHENLKMDTALPKQDIALQNCILNAYSNLQDVSRVKDLFLSMSPNPKQIGGVNEETIQIMIKTYTYSDMMYVKEFWNNLSQFDITPNYAIFKQYLIAHVYHGLIDDAIGVIGEMEDYGLEISSDTLLSMHNFCLETDKQKLISDWAAANHTHEWDKVIASGLLKGATNYVPENNLIAESTKE